MRKLAVLISILLLVFASLYLGRTEIESLYLKLFNKLPVVQQLVKKQVNTAPPLRAKVESPKAFLTLSGVIKFTNEQRVKNGLPPLNNNALLNQSVAKKAQDMLSKQYFAHVSPDGIDVSDLAQKEGYEFITIGENLALGNFLNDQTLIQAWMDSPGHRANILNNRYTEIGAAVTRGIYEGRSTWIAVQHFGKPLSDCPKPDKTLAQKLDDNKTRLDVLQKELEVKKKELDEIQPDSSEYNQKIEEYNTLVSQYNNLLEEAKGLIQQYNKQVNAFNVCAS